MKKIKKILLAVLAAALAACSVLGAAACGKDEKPDFSGGGTSTGSSDTGSSDTGSSDVGSSDTGSSDTGSSSAGQADPFLTIENFVVKESVEKDAYQKQIECTIEEDQYVLKIHFYHKGLTYKYTMKAPVQEQTFTTLTMTITDFERDSNQPADRGGMDAIKGKTTATVTFDWESKTADCSQVYIPLLYIGPFN